MHDFDVVTSFKKDGKEILVYSIEFLERMGFNSGNFVLFLLRYKKKGEKQ